MPISHSDPWGPPHSRPEPPTFLPPLWRAGGRRRRRMGSSRTALSPAFCAPPKSAPISPPGSFPRQRGKQQSRHPGTSPTFLPPFAGEGAEGGGGELANCAELGLLRSAERRPHQPSGQLPPPAGKQQSRHPGTSPTFLPPFAGGSSTAGTPATRSRLSLLTPLHSLPALRLFPFPPTPARLGPPYVAGAIRCLRRWWRAARVGAARARW
jgi:hypothetical protein